MEPAAPAAILLLAAAQRRCGAASEAEGRLRRLLAQAPGVWGAWYELGAALAIRGATDDAVGAFRRALALNPGGGLAAAALADQLLLTRSGDSDPIVARARRLRREPRLASLARGFEPKAEDWPMRLANAGLDANDPVSINLLAQVGLDSGAPGQVERLTDAALARWPAYAALRFSRAVSQIAQARAPSALADLETLSSAFGSPPIQCALAEARVQLREDAEARTILDAVAKDRPDDVRVWIALGHVRKTLGDASGAIGAYRRAIALAPDCGEAYAALANLKVTVFDAADQAAMRAQLSRADVRGRARADFHFALAKALEDAGDIEAGFEQYRLGNALRRSQEPHDADAHTAFVTRSMSVFTPAILAARAGLGCADPAPIFVVGLPRSGSTLVEQILACHPDVEACDELPVLPAIAAEAVRLCGGRAADYPSGLQNLAAADLEALGALYLREVEPYRKLGRPRFVDKLPGNVLHLGLIALILPGARIVDVRRDAEPCCVSLFRQNFAAGQSYSYDLADLGRYYRDYVRLMDHMDAALPRPAVRVRYESLVATPEAEIRELLGRLDLPFHPACLRPDRSERPVRTASAEQVRRPISSAGLEGWRAFRPWLAPLYAGLEAVR